MKGSALIDELKRRISRENGGDPVSDAALARALGVSVPMLANWRGCTLTPRQVANLMQRYAKSAEHRFAATAVVPLVEFLEIYRTESKQGARWELFSIKDDDDEPHPYFEGLRRKLESSHGIYIFHDSRGRAIYAGKAHKLSLWAEMNNAFNRDRGEVQSIKRVSHPFRKVPYKAPDHRQQISREVIPLHEITAYASAYEVPEALIGKFEALIVRSFANDLLNVRMENFNPLAAAEAAHPKRKATRSPAR